MKKLISAFLCLALLAALAVPTLADAGPVITLQPQSPNFPENSIASYTVKASGSNLHAYWYMEWEGKTYNLSDTSGGSQPWEAYAGETYGATQEDANTFVYFFGGIGHQLNGATIWCEVEDGHYNAVSQKAHISIGNPSDPPQILSIPAQVTAQQGSKPEIRCVATAPGNTQLSFAWYETATGNLPDIMALDIDGDCFFPDAGKVGTRYYVCMVRTNEGGIAYSSVVPVTITAAGAGQDVEATIITELLPEAVAGQPYNTKIVCSDENALFSVSYNPGGANDFDALGLTLSGKGVISGTPAKAGTYGFTVCASNSAGDAYMSYIFTVKEATAEATDPTDQPGKDTVQDNEKDDATTPTKDKKKDRKDDDDDSDTTMQWLIPVVIGVVAAGAGAVTAVLVTKKKTK